VLASWVYRPRGEEEVAAAILDARRRGLTIAHRGAFDDLLRDVGRAIYAAEGRGRYGAPPSRAGPRLRHEPHSPVGASESEWGRLKPWRLVHIVCG